MLVFFPMKALRMTVCSVVLLAIPQLLLAADNRLSLQDQANAVFLAVSDSRQFVGQSGQVRSITVGQTGTVVAFLTAQDSSPRVTFILNGTHVDCRLGATIAANREEAELNFSDCVAPGSSPAPLTVTQAVIQAPERMRRGALENATKAMIQTNLHGKKIRLDRIRSLTENPGCTALPTSEGFSAHAKPNCFGL